MLILKDGRQIGTIGGGCAESEILQKGRQMFSDERTSLACSGRYDSGPGRGRGMVCGGTIEVALEKI